MALLVVLLLVGVIFLGSLAIGWTILARETTARAANAVLVMFVGFGLAAWVLSQASFGAGYGRRRSPSRHSVNALVGPPLFVTGAVFAA